ncbi:MAG TPA: hypothetical protein VGB68_11335 [Pyrinomonadaceae bacterium]|jgi:hypothetical protein
MKKASLSSERSLFYKSQPILSDKSIRRRNNGAGSGESAIRVFYCQIPPMMPKTRVIAIEEALFAYA